MTLAPTYTINNYIWERPPIPIPVSYEPVWTMDLNICELSGNLYKESSKSQHFKSVHTSEKNYECDQCDKKFKTVKDLKHHIKRDVHHNILFSCDQCTKSFKTIRNLRRHVQSIHEGKIFFCACCGSGLKTKNKMEIHYERCKEKSRKKLKQYPNGKVQNV